MLRGTLRVSVTNSSQVGRRVRAGRGGAWWGPACCSLAHWHHRTGGGAALIVVAGPVHQERRSGRPLIRCCCCDCSAGSLDRRGKQKQQFNVRFTTSCTTSFTVNSTNCLWRGEHGHPLHDRISRCETSVYVRHGISSRPQLCSTSFSGDCTYGLWPSGSLWRPATRRSGGVTFITE